MNESKTYKSKILEAIHETASDLHEAKTMDKQTLRKLDAMRLQPIKALTQEEILSILSQHKPEWEKRFHLKSLALFGSFARGDQQSVSDVDILVDVDPRIGLDFVTLAESIESSLGMPADVISKRAISSRHWQEIEGDLIYV